MKRFALIAICALFSSLALFAMGAETTHPSIGADGKAADTRPIAEPYTNTGNWMQRHNGFVAQAKQGNIDLVLLGDSITDGWAQTGRAVFQKEFGGWKTANFGIGGDTCQNIIYRISNGELDGFKAKAIMLLIGTNNSRSYIGDEIGQGVTKIVEIIKEKQPDAKLLLLAIFPRGPDANDLQRQRVEAANKIIAKLDDSKNVKFLSINDKFLDSQGKLIGFNADNLHPNAKGYQIWADGVKAQLTEWLGPPTATPAPAAPATGTPATPGATATAPAATTPAASAPTVAPAPAAASPSKN
jgi:lysophospholipase L1-like esterase